MKQKIIYIHGLGSDGTSKAGALSTLSGISDVYIADYPEDIELAKIYLDELIKTNQDCILIGSSMGGYLADYYSEKYNLPCVLLNPLVDTNDLMQFNHSITPNDISALSKLKPDYISRNNKLVLLCTNDEIFDYNKAFYKYNKIAKVHIQEGGDHRFSNIDESLPIIQDFINDQISRL